MEADSPRPSLTSDLDQTRYNPATHRIWPWPALLLEEVAGTVPKIVISDTP